MDKLCDAYGEQPGSIGLGGTLLSRTAWWEEFTTTHRQAIISAFRQLADE